MNNKSSTQIAIQRLEASSGTRLVLLLGPGGSGKTALLKRWVSSRQTTPAALVDLSPQDDSPCVFVSKLIHTLNGSGFPSDSLVDGLSQGVGKKGFSNLKLEAKSALLLSILEKAPQGFALILDHFQHISHPDVYEIVTMILDYLPEHVYMVIASRTEPPLQISRLRVRRELVEIEI